MKRLVYYCRWQRVRLRLRGRDDDGVWGQLVAVVDGVEEAESFRFDFRSGQLTLGEDEAQRVLQLDEMGTEVDRQESGGG